MADRFRFLPFYEQDHVRNGLVLLIRTFKWILSSEKFFKFMQIQISLS